MARLIFQIGDGKSVDFDLSGAVVTLGRSTSNDIVINNSWISSHHARFERSGGNVEVTSLGSLHGIPIKEFKRVGGEYTVTDLDSHNGVMVNGQRIKSRRLTPGDVLSFGQLQAVFQDAPAHPASPPPAHSGDTPFASPTSEPSDPRPVTQRLVKKLHAASPTPNPSLSAPTIPLFSQPRQPQPSPPSPPPPSTAKLAPLPPSPPDPPSPKTKPSAAPVPLAQTEPPRPPAVPTPAALPPPPPSPPIQASPSESPISQARATVVEPAPPEPDKGVRDSGVGDIASLPPDILPPAASAPATPPNARSVLASLHRDVALLEQSIGALQGSLEAPAESDHSLARGLIQRIDLLEDLMASDAGLADRLAPLHGSLLDLLKEHAIEPFTLPIGHLLDVATRKRITIVEAAQDGEGVTEIAEIFRPGYQLLPPPLGTPPIILRKAEVRTIRRSLAQVT